MMVVDVATRPTFRVGTPRALFKGGSQFSTYDVSSDGRRFLTIQRTEPQEAGPQIQVVLNWTEELKRLVPAN